MYLQIGVEMNSEEILLLEEHGFVSSISDEDLGESFVKRDSDDKIVIEVTKCGEFEGRKPTNIWYETELYLNNSSSVTIITPLMLENDLIKIIHKNREVFDKFAHNRKRFICFNFCGKFFDNSKKLIDCDDFMKMINYPININKVHFVDLDYNEFAIKATLNNEFEFDLKIGERINLELPFHNSDES